MWERAGLKYNAKLVLKTNYWMAFAVSLVAGILTGGASGTSSRVSNSIAQNSGSYPEWGTQSWDSIIGSMISAVGMATIVSVGLLLFLLGVAYSIFLANPIEVGRARYFVQSRKQVSRFTLLFSSFREKSYLGAVTTMLLRDVYLFLWFLLLIIPGIVKSYAYRLVPYILADNPNIGAQRAIELSNQMTKGEKLEIFVLDLSFLGWFLLSLIPCGLGIVFLSPYISATNAELYAALKEKAYRNGICTPAELGE